MCVQNRTFQIIYQAFLENSPKKKLPYILSTRVQIIFMLSALDASVDNCYRDWRTTTKEKKNLIKAVVHASI